jgi:hypothetical protein
LTKEKRRSILYIDEGEKSPESESGLVAGNVNCFVRCIMDYLFEALDYGYECTVDVLFDGTDFLIVTLHTSHA